MPCRWRQCPANGNRNQLTDLAAALATNSSLSLLFLSKYTSIAPIIPISQIES